MTTSLRVVVTAAVVGIAGQVCAQAQTVGAVPSGVHLPSVRLHDPASTRPGSISSLVRDASGLPVAGAIVSAVGGRTVTAMTDARGRCTLPALPAGEYLVRVHRSGYTVGTSLLVRVGAGDVVSHSAVLLPIGMDRATALGGQAAGLLGAGFVPAATTGQTDTADEDSDHDHGETAWRLRHVTRSVLRDTAEQPDLVDGGEITTIEPAVVASLGGDLAAPARSSSALFGQIPFNGQVNLLTTSTFDTPDQLLSDVNFARGIAYVSIGAAAGSHGDWSVQGAMTQGDVASWVFAGSFISRAPTRHHYQAGVSYAAQRYNGPNPMSIAAVADGSRNSGAVFAFDTWTLTRRAVVVYGARYARYGYIDRALFSPRVELTVTPFDRYEKLRLRLAASRRAEAPGAEEFVASSIANTWVPPQRTFAPLIGTTFTPEQSHTYRVDLERDLSASTLVSVGSFYQRTWDQSATIFGVGRPERVAVSSLDHYLVANAGDFVARGWSVSLHQVIARRLRGTVDYTITTAHWHPSADAAVLGVVVPSAMRTGSERMSDLTTSLETDIPLTATRIFAMYKFNTGYAGAALTPEPPQLGTRFDVQLTQSLPFLNFTSAQWEALVGVRNLFHEMGDDVSVYDEVLVVRPPKRVVGGVTVRF